MRDFWTEGALERRKAELPVNWRGKKTCREQEKATSHVATHR